MNIEDESITFEILGEGHQDTENEATMLYEISESVV